MPTRCYPGTNFRKFLLSVLYAYELERSFSYDFSELTKLSSVLHRCCVHSCVYNLEFGCAAYLKSGIFFCFLTAMIIHNTCSRFLVTIMKKDVIINSLCYYYVHYVTITPVVECQHYIIAFILHRVLSFSSKHAHITRYPFKNRSILSARIITYMICIFCRFG